MKQPRVSPLFREVELSFQTHLSPRVRSRRLAAYALEKITEAKRINAGEGGGLAPHRQIVDGKEGAPLIAVKPNGVIVARFDLLSGTLDWIAAEIRRVSPVRSGRFRDSHVLYVDEVPHEPGTPYPDGKEFVFMNVQPYARRLEKGHSKQAPDGVYEGISAVASKRFGNLARVSFSFRSLEGATALDAWVAKTGVQMTSRGKVRGNQSGWDEWLKRQPAIVVRPF